MQNEQQYFCRRSFESYTFNFVCVTLKRHFKLKSAIRKYFRNMKVTDKAESTIGLTYIHLAICFVSTHFSIPIYAFNRTNIYLFVGKVCQEKVHKSSRHLYR